MPIRIDEETMDVLEKCTTDGHVLYLPEGQLERPLYEKVNKILTALGGKWSRQHKGHFFESHLPDHLLQDAITTGEVMGFREEFQFFPTPEPLADRLVSIADLEDGLSILEPSAGQGALLNAILRGTKKFSVGICLVELDPRNVSKLQEDGYEVTEADFLTLDWDDCFDRIIMNPPFSRQQDVDHVLHAWTCLKPGGILVSIMSPGWRHRVNNKSKMFRDFLIENGGVTFSVEEGAFKESGTMIRTCIVRMKKP